ncbi:hypothetical protein [Salipiger sp. PrR002]|uniref:hypothetical protein n=1 Tax=Salipiger sp. PrR002 TaxID=2706489 RepID=UPI0013B5EDEE|nr:hypothetical protein [Salipiger sp. PrR002]NDW01504.1 hypothetical protein [Salipiger sp. PrR002]NDW58261.1 hypothetical protein [Salipiger sp. PrR004]
MNLTPQTIADIRPHPSIPPAALKARGGRRLLGTVAFALASGVFVHCGLPLF